MSFRIDLAFKDNVAIFLDMALGYITVHWPYVSWEEKFRLKATGLKKEQPLFWNYPIKNPNQFWLHKLLSRRLFI